MNIGFVVTIICASVVFPMLVFYVYRKDCAWYWQPGWSLHKGEKIHRRLTIVLGSIVSFIVAILLFSGVIFTVHSLFESGRESEIEDGLEARGYVQEVLVKNYPELEGVDPKTVVFDNNGGVSMVVTAPTRITVDDLFTYRVMENYFEKYRFDVRSRIEFQFFISEIILSLFIAFIIGLFVVGGLVNPYSILDDHLPDFDHKKDYAKT